MKNERWEAIEGLFHAARELRGEDRTRFLNRECGADAAMRRKVDALLRGDEKEGILNTDRPRITTGTKIGPYEIVGWLGAGGMGEVYRARDPRLGRDVAIKLISEEFAADASRVHRFEQEARAAGQLNHPNILAVYDVGQHDDTPYLVSELLEGESLRSKLQGGVLPVRKAIDYARQTAEGLATAHDKGIVHRDLKPDNLFITSEGRLKILDFGLAKLTQPSDEASRPTKIAADTEAGIVMGTVGYMSPEQVRGEVVDHRSDIFSFGVVLYELLTGRQPFSHGTPTETMAAILKEDPPELLASGISPALARIVSRCLEKARETRFQSARDLAFGLEFLSGTAPAAPAHEPVTGRHPRLRDRALPWSVVGVLALGFVGTAVWQLRPSPPLAVHKIPLELPDGQHLNGSGGAHMVALSPDGTQMAYAATPFRLYLRSMSELDFRAIPGTESYKGVREPVFSPNGDWIVFYAYADQTLKKIAVTGGAAVTICKADSPTGINWGPDGIVFGQGRKGIMRVSPDSGSTPEQLLRVKDGEAAHGPQILPDGKHVLFTLATDGSARDRWDKARIVVQSLTSEEPETLIEGGSDARYVPTGHIVYALVASLYAVAFDLQQLKVRSDPVKIVEGVSRAAGNFTGAANFSFSKAGDLIYVPGPASASPALLDIGLMDRAGTVKALKLPAGAYTGIRVSPDDERIAFGNDDDKDAIVWIYDLSGTSAMRPLTSGGNNRFPTWTHDSKRVAFQSDRDGDLAIFWQPVDGGKAERLVTPEPGESLAPESWYRDTLLFSVKKGADVSLWTYSLRKKKKTPFGAVHSSGSTGAVFSPDGRWVAYSSTEKSLTTIYIQSFPDNGTRYPLFAKEADLPHFPRWSPDGKELFYDPRPFGFEVVSVITEPAFAFGNAAPLPARIGLGPPETRTNYDITSKGGILGVITAGHTEFVRGPDNQIIIHLNWFEDLKARVPHR